MAKLTFTWPPIAASLSSAGLATSAKQDTGNASVASIDTKTPALGQALAASSVPVVLTAAQISTLTPPTTVAATQSGAWSITDISGTVSLPTGAATAANQTTANSSLSSIDTKTPALGQALAAGSVPVVLTAAQISTLTPLATVAATQSGTWNVTNVSGTVSLPTGASTETTLSALNSKVTAVNTGAVVVSSSALPTGAATESTLSTLNGKVPALGQALAADSVPVVLTAAQLSTLTPLTSVAATQSGTWTVQPGNTANTTAWLVKTGGKTAVNKARNDYTSTSVTTATYVQLIASTSAAITEVEIFDSSGQTLVLAVGAAASEVDQIYILPGGNGKVPLTIAASSRVSVKAVSAPASVGELTINFYG